jgi:hypothetical protein
VLGVLFLVKLARVHADHDERLVLVLFLQILEIGEHVHAVDAAIRPEIEQNDMAFEVFDCDGLSCVEPPVGSREIRGRNLLTLGRVFLFLPVCEGGQSQKDRCNRSDQPNCACHHVASSPAPACEL